MRTHLKWKRVGRLSGPGNVLNNRYTVMPGGAGRWYVRDRAADGPGTTGLRGPRGGFPTMREARSYAEDAAITDR